MESENMSTTVIQVSDSVLNKMLSFYDDCLLDNKNQYILFSAKVIDGPRVNAYKSGKVVFQGNNHDTESLIWSSSDNNSNKNNLSTKDNQFNNNLNIIGSDESGVGDVFGPLVVCAFYASKDDVKKLKDIGIDDSKKFSDDKIFQMADKLIDKFTYKIISLSNNKINRLADKGFNYNKIKALMHNTALFELNKSVNADKVVIDEFCSKKNYFSYLTDQNEVFTNLEFHQKGESKFISIAAASILARHRYVKKLDEISKDIGIDLLKGASKKVDEQVDKVLEKYGTSKLLEISKKNFKNIYSKL